MFQELFASIEILFFFWWGEHWALGYNSIKFWDFPDISWFPKILCLKSFGNSWGNWYIACLLLTMTLRNGKFRQTSKRLKILDCTSCTLIQNLSPRTVLQKWYSLLLNLHQNSQESDFFDKIPEQNWCFKTRYNKTHISNLLEIEQARHFCTNVSGIIVS